MKIGANNLYAEMQAMANRSASPIGQEIPALEQKVQNPTHGQFGDMLNRAIENVNEMSHHSKNLTNRFEMGDPNVTLADVMIAKSKSGIAFEATVQVRNKVLEAYDKIINMPV
ncbi:flagellar hook-basal body complex protein FliE [Gayadomonas joobiniege]|uniref:flagellar hook-basal body complex protein FliE n=1 Tax=Gayadomonas joobiniege TaxID=1234606 RepID=UPI00037D16D2|nr:flagellar hook-basal body complex protein FliE [Gayadomonas joobiniege]